MAQLQRNAAPHAKKIFYFASASAIFNAAMRHRPINLLLALSLACWAWLASGCSHGPIPTTPPGPVILISIDGFRWDYLTKYPAPTLRKLAAAGVHARRLIPSFPSKTFPNHYSLVTGLHPEHHGVVSNYFFDPALNASFNKGRPADNADARWWSQGEPIWITAEKAGRRAACFFWPGSEAELQGLRPSYHKPYAGPVQSVENVDDLLRQFDLPPAQRPALCALYFDSVDIKGHKFGPDSPETSAAVAEVDRAIARLLDGLEQRHLRRVVNFVIVSDHGMTEISTERVIFLEDLMTMSQVQVESYGPNGGVRPKTGTPAELVAAIRAKAVPHLQVYVREEVPADLHYRDNPRIPPVVLVADEGWSIETKLGWPKLSANYDRGTHGYDPKLPSMGALFIAQGPAFRSGLELPDVENIHVYNLLCALLGLTPAPNDGDRRLAAAALRP